MIKGWLAAMIIALSVVALVASVSVLSGPAITPLTENKPSTEDALTCTWTPSADTVSQTVAWWNGSVRYSGPTSVSLGLNKSVLNAFIAAKGENWTCEVTVNNGTATSAINQSVLIKNALPTPPNATDETFYEDQERTFTIHSDDSDHDILTYYKLGTSPTFCSITASSGLIDCLPTIDDIGLANATYLVDDGGGKYYAKTNVTYTVIAVNDPPSFTVANQSILEGAAFYYDIPVTDEENNFPVQVSVSSNLSVVLATTTDASTARIYLNRSGSKPIYADTGLWTVTVNITDNGSATNTPYDNPTTIKTFLLNITSINHAPTITTNFSAMTIAGTQGSQLTFFVNATDIDAGDTLTFMASSNCSLSNPWSITTVNNSQNATGMVNVTLTNDHVLCRWVNISVSDSKESSSEMVFVNVTNTNDAPSIQEISHYAGNSGVNMSNLSAVTGMTFTYRVNATDPDLATYAGDNLTFTDNGTGNISVDASGVLSFLPTSADIGVHTLLVNVTDSGGLWATHALRLQVENNTPPTLLPIGNFSCNEDALCQRFIDAVDPDAGENLVFSSNNSAIFNLTDYNATSWLLSFTPTNSQVGAYKINVSVADRYNFTDEEVFTFTINNTNDAPFFDQDGDGTPDTLDFGTVVENHPVVYRVNVTDDDLAIGLDNLTYNWSFVVDPHNMSGSFSFVNEQESSFTVLLSPTSAQVGSYEVNLSVTDSAGATYWQVVAFAVLAKTNDPVVEDIKPYVSGNTTVLNAFGNASLFSGNEVNVTVAENTTVVFDALISNDSGISNNHLDYTWFINGVQAAAGTNVVPGSNSSLSKLFDFFSAGEYTVLLHAVDMRYAEVNWTWNVEVTNVNRDPVFTHIMPNITVNRSSDFSDFMSHTYNGSTWQQLFYDPDDDVNGDGKRGETTGENTSLTYSIATGYGCSIASFGFSQDTLSINPSSEGTCIVKFTATDPYNRSVDSNVLWVTITAIEVQEVQTPTSSGGGASRPRTIPYPFEQPVDTPYPIELIAPESVVTYNNDTVDIPLTLHNSWQDTINGVWLNATTKNSTYQPSFKFSTEYFPSIAADENVSVTLRVTGYREEAPLAVVASATVSDPSYTDSATIIISSMEQRSSGDDVESKVTFARDLLNDNPECQELNELLVKAEEERVNGNSDQAVQLVTKVVNGCKYLINEQKAVTPEQPKSFFSVMTISPKQLPALIIGGVIVLVLIVFGVILLATGRKKMDI